MKTIKTQEKNNNKNSIKKETLKPLGKSKRQNTLEKRKNTYIRKKETTKNSIKKETIEKLEKRK